MSFSKTVSGGGRGAGGQAFGGAPGLSSFDMGSQSGNGFSQGFSNPGVSLGGSQDFGTIANTGDPTIDLFCNSWSLDGKAVETLVSLDPETKSRVMSSFTPKDVTRGASAAFMGFVKGMIAGTGRGASGAGQAHGGVALPISNPSIQQFVDSWQLDPQAQTALTRLDPSCQAKVMAGFAPKDTSRGASAAFMGFCRSVAGAAGGHGGGFAAQPPAFTAGGGGGFGNSSGGDPNLAAEIENFVLQWGLDEKAQSVLVSLDLSTQQRVIAGFAPKDVSRGASAAFMAFSRSIGGGGKGGMQQRFGPY